jgi:hypothetical protein
MVAGFARTGNGFIDGLEPRRRKQLVETVG